MFISELTTLEDAGVILAAQATALTPKDPQSKFHNFIENYY